MHRTSSAWLAYRLPKGMHVNDIAAVTKLHPGKLGWYYPYRSVLPSVGC